MPKTMPAGQLEPPSPASSSATKIGIRPRRTTVSAFGSRASGAETAGVAMAQGYARPRSAGSVAAVAGRLTISGFVDAHCHAFQRALRGRSHGGDFWAWREVMIAEAERQTPESVRRGYVDVYRELLVAGYTAVGEFHYLGLEEARAAA